MDAVPRPGEPDRPGTDAAVTALPGVALAVLTADCVPVLLADPQAGVVGVAHAGRVGAAAGVLAATLTAMEGLGARRGRLRGAAGSRRCAGPATRCPRRCATRSRRPCPAAPPDPPRARRAWTCGPGLRAQLAALGVARVGVDPRCTVEDPDLYSYRRDRRHRPPRRRHLARPVPLARESARSSARMCAGVPASRHVLASECRVWGEAVLPQIVLSLATSCRLALSNVPTRAPPRADSPVIGWARERGGGPGRGGAAGGAGAAARGRAGADRGRRAPPPGVTPIGWN